MNLLGIAGSLRKDSLNKKLLACAAAMAREMGREMRIADLSDVPLYNGDVEAAGLPPGVAAFREELKWADAIVIATPEYNNSFPGVLKNAIDWGSSRGNCWDGKVLALMGATPGNFGTVMAQAQLRNIFNILNAFIVPFPFVYVPRAHEAFNADGSLNNAMAAENMKNLLGRLFQVTEALKQRP
ncbi:MAG: NAD(P)H-dependent oxidoreductase [Candidatus Sumerlaeaceae bacterium]|nr:NAD(P)H-dependent oxidoreductase [Candidatus Sumerlaeaceae bacterium]